MVINNIENRQAEMCEQFLRMKENGFAILQYAPYVDETWMTYQEYIDTYNKIRCAPLEMVYYSQLSELQKNDAGAKRPRVRILDDILVTINLDTPDDYAGGHLKTGDIIVVKEGNQLDSYYFDANDYQKLEDGFFDRFTENVKRRIVVALVNPREDPQFVYIDPGFQMYRTIESWPFEVIPYSEQSDLYLIKSSDDQLDFNREIADMDVFGTCIVAKKGKKDFESLSSKDIIVLSYALQLPVTLEPIKKSDFRKIRV